MGSLGCMGCFKVSHKAYTGVSAHTWTLTLHTHQYLLDVSSRAAFSAGSAKRNVHLTAASYCRSFLLSEDFHLFSVSSHLSCLHLFFSRLLTSSSWAPSTVWPDISASSMLIRPTWPLFVLHHYFPSLFGFAIFCSPALFRFFPHPLIFSSALSSCALPLGILKNALFFCLPRRCFAAPWAQRVFCSSRWVSLEETLMWVSKVSCEDSLNVLLFCPIFFLSPFLLLTQPSLG